jgi:hypothetical protein
VGGKIGTAEMAKKRGHFQLQSFARIHLTKNLYTTIAEFLILKKTLQKTNYLFKKLGIDSFVIFLNLQKKKNYLKEAIKNLINLIAYFFVSVTF